MRASLAAMYEAHKDRAFDSIESAMRHIHGLDGIWSIDLMLDDLEDFWLIDMAVGRTSAYYDKDKIREAGGVI